MRQFSSCFDTFFFCPILFCAMILTFDVKDRYKQTEQQQIEVQTTDVLSYKIKRINL